MSSYIKAIFTQLDQEQKDLLVAILSNCGFEGFEEEDDSLMAYIREEDFDEQYLEQNNLINSFPYLLSRIPETNWNQIWELEFKPVVIRNFVAIRAAFHSPIDRVEHELIITPKMSFGTGHHATTVMMIEAMEKLDFKNRTVLDFGTGTGVLAVLAEKLGAESITAIDHDEWSTRNADENILANSCLKIEVRKQDFVPVDKKFEIILANINKNVLLQHAASIRNALQRQGVLVISGIRTDDLPEITEAFGPPSFMNERNIWLCLTF